MTDDQVFEMFSFLAHAAALTIVRAASLGLLACMVGRWGDWIEDLPRQVDEVTREAPL